MPRPVKIALVWAAGIILATLALTTAGDIGLLPTQLASNIAAGLVLALSWLATTLIVRNGKNEAE